MQQKIKNENLNSSDHNTERILKFFIIFFSFVALTSFILSLSSYLIAKKSNKIINNIVTIFENGNIYSNDDCFECVVSNENEVAKMMIKNQINMKSYTTQNTFDQTSITLGSIVFPNSNYDTSIVIGSESWFNNHIRITDNVDVYLTDYIKNGYINSIQFGSFDFDSSTNKTSICNQKNAKYGSVYYAIDEINDNKYLCICVNLPVNSISPKESCHSLTSI